MIIECGSCNSRFRLDESKIKGRGARVRCRKCGEPITVMKPDAAGPGEAGLAPEGLDLRSIVREAMEAPAAAHTPGPAAAPEPQSEPGETVADVAREADAATAESPATGDRWPGEPEIREQPPAEGPAIDFGAEEELTFPSHGREEAPAAETPAPAVPPAEPGPARSPDAPAPEFMMSTADSLDFLKADYDKAERKADLDISGSLRIAPSPGTDEGKVAAPLGAQRAPHAPPPVEPPSRPAESRIEPAGPAGESAEAATEAGLPATAAASPRGTVAATPSSPPPRAAAATERPPAPGRRPAAKSAGLKRRQSSQLVRPSVVLLLLLFFALAGGGAYLAFTSGGQRTLRGLVPQIASLWPGGGKAVSAYTVGNLIGYYESNGAAGRMFVIKGQVTNEGRQHKTGVRIHAALLDARNTALAEKTVYAGNVLAGEVLRKATREKIEEAMSNPIGGGLANMDVPPGKSIPFMVVFFDAPEGVDSYRLEPRDVD